MLVQLRDGDATVGAFEADEDLGQGLDGIGANAAEFAGVEIVLGALGVDLGVDDAAEAVGDGGDAGGGHAAIHDEGDVGGELLLMLFDVGLDGFAAALLFALDEDFEVDGEGVTGAGEGAQRHEGGEDLAFVVHGATGVEVLVADDGLEGVRLIPWRLGVGRLDVVVAVEQDGGLARGFDPFAIDEGVALRLDDLDLVEADLFEGASEEFGGPLDVLLVLGEGADAGDAQEVFELVEVVGAVGVGVGEGGVEAVVDIGGLLLLAFDQPAELGYGVTCRLGSVGCGSGHRSIVAPTMPGLSRQYAGEERWRFYGTLLLVDGGPYGTRVKSAWRKCLSVVNASVKA